MSDQTSDHTQPETRKPLATGRIALIAALLGAVIFVCLNIVSAQIFRNARVDLTQQHLYSLSQGSRSLLGELKEPVVALADRLGLAGNPMMRMPEQQVLAQMKQFFDVKPLSGEVEKLPDDTRVLMVVHPQDLSEKTLYTIDQWVMAGNATMIFVDPFAENQLGPRGMPSPNPTSNLEPLFKAWGVKFDTTRAVGDPDYALQTERNVGGRPVASQNLPWMALRGDALARDQAILAQLSAVVMTTAGAFETTSDGVT